MDALNRGHMSQSEFKKSVIEDLGAVNDVTLVSRPTTTRLKDYEGDKLIKCFPLQFPYGVVAHNIYERHCTSSVAYLRCKYKSGGST